LAGGSGVLFVALFATHRVLQGGGPAAGSAEVISAYLTEHRGAWLLSQILNGLGLVMFMLFVVSLAGALRRTDGFLAAAGVIVSGSVFVALGMVSTAAETALLAVAGSGQPAAVLVLFELQARVPVVFAVAAFTAVTALAAWRGGLVPPWLGVIGLVAAGVFLIAAALSMLAPVGAGDSSPIGPALFAVWLLVLCGGLFRASGAARRGA
jgi:hypothetical protein